MPYKSIRVVWLIVFLLVILGIFTYLLFAPFYLEINSINGLYGIRFHYLAQAKLIITDSSIKINLRIAGWQKQIDLLAKTGKRKQREKQRPSESKNKPQRISWSMAKAVLKSFKVNKCYLKIDSGNMQLNGILYPAFYWLSKYSDKPIGINFFGKNEIVLEIENNLARIAGAFIYHLFIFKKQKSWTTLMNYSAN